jgi:DnaK suppressor protein
MDLEKYRAILLAKQQEILADLNRSIISGRESVEAGGFDLVDESVMSERKEGHFAQADRDRKLLKEIQEALKRIEDGTYGLCLEEGEPISEARLNAVPWVRYCVKHQELRDADSTSEDEQAHAERVSTFHTPE